jgi:hypothetical protein
MQDSIKREYNEPQTFEAETFFHKSAKFLAGIVGNIVGNVTGNVVGNVTGNVTGNTSGSAGSCTGNAATATLATTAKNVAIASDDLATVAPTNAQLAAAFGGTSNLGIFFDTDAGNAGVGAVAYLCAKDGAGNWHIEALTAAA